ncbi:TPA: ribonuclease HII [Candidatus Woesearchaeota archaeon]|nr:ribonuclease HII [Candidatus Woesearchaeota archaeon]HII66163.1 ribonuclease HII [Candidatus Woesearchaeota archaeon]
MLSKTICGVDEAGRGPIIGPMVMAGVLIDEKDERKLRALGVKDSKLLTPPERERLFGGITEAIRESAILIISPQEIDAAVRGHDGLNLNRLEAKKTVEILDTLRPDLAYIDSPSTNLSQYKSLLLSKLRHKPKLVVEHKADTHYVTVGAASILAKVTRDAEVRKLHKEVGIDFGSGYLSDPKTVAFFEKHHADYPELFRKSWAPYQDKLSSKFQSTLEQYSQAVSAEKDKGVREKLRQLEELGYTPVPVASAHEELRLKGHCTVTLYKNGKVLVQGKDKEKVEKFLGL